MPRINYNYEMFHRDLEYLKDLVDEMIGELDGRPYVFAFAIKNNMDKTEFLLRYNTPADAGCRLYNDTMTRLIYENFDGRYNGNVPEFKPLSLNRTEKKNISGKISDLLIFCKEKRIPFFVMIAATNESKVRKNGTVAETTTYITEILSPYALKMKITDDKISHSLRYTISPDAYPETKPSILSDGVNIFGSEDSGLMDDIIRVNEGNK